MLTILASLASVIFALIALVAHFYEKTKADSALLGQSGVKDQLNAIDGQITKNQALIDAEKENLVEKEKNLTNEDIINNLNNPPKP